MRILIIEDEVQSADKLKNYLTEIDSSLKVSAILKSVKESIAYLKSHTEPDLIFLDVQLTDGVSFDIFKQVTSEAFIVFVTAYDRHSLQAFDLNTVSYLLKPFDRTDVLKALGKYHRIRNRSKQEADQDRFVVKKGSSFYTLSSNEIAYFLKESVLYLVTKSGERYLYEASLSSLEETLDSQVFFRISRSCIVHYESIKSFQPHSSHRYKLNLIHEKQDELVVSQARASAFKKWIRSVD